MKKRITVPTEMAQTLVQVSNQQELVKGAPKSYEPKEFPVFGTPLFEDLLVYIPHTMSQQVDGVTMMNPLSILTHDTRRGKTFQQVRCIHGIDTSSEFAQSLGFDGTCPYCDATPECWELYNTKLAKIADRMGIDPQNDTAKVLDGTKRTLMSEFAIKPTDEYVVFPIVVIPNSKSKPRELDSGKTMEELVAGLQPYYVIWRKQRWLEKIMGRLEEFGQTCPSGQVWMFKFTYPLKDGQKPELMMCGKNMSCSPLTAMSDSMQAVAQAAEARAAAFTAEKAIDVLMPASFYEMAEAQAEVDSLMSSTRTQLASLQSGKDAPATGAAVPAGAPAMQMLSAFGATPAAVGVTPGNVVTGQSAVAPAPAAAPAPGVQFNMNPQG